LPAGAPNSGEICSIFYFKFIQCIETVCIKNTWGVVIFMTSRWKAITWSSLPGPKLPSQTVPRNQLNFSCSSAISVLLSLLCMSFSPNAMISPLLECLGLGLKLNHHCWWLI
jgi:hypothetical protein